MAFFLLVSLAFVPITICDEEYYDTKEICINPMDYLETMDGYQSKSNSNAINPIQPQISNLQKDAHKLQGGKLSLDDIQSMLINLQNELGTHHYYFKLYVWFSGFVWVTLLILFGINTFVIYKLLADNNNNNSNNSDSIISKMANYFILSPITSIVLYHMH